MKGTKPSMGVGGEPDLKIHLQQTRKALSIEYMALVSVPLVFASPARWGAA